MTLHAGMRLCITGDVEGASKEELARRLRSAGFEVEGSVTKGTDLLIAADPASQSGKAERARRYGIPIVATSSMMTAAVGDRVEVSVLAVERLTAHACTRCGATWAAATAESRRAALCENCRGVHAGRKGSTTVEQGSDVAAVSVPRVATEDLICSTCGRGWQRPVARGRKPKSCPDCRG